MIADTLLRNFNDSISHTSLGEIMALDTAIYAVPYGISPPYLENTTLVRLQVKCKLVMLTLWMEFTYINYIQAILL